MFVSDNNLEDLVITIKNSNALDNRLFVVGDDLATVEFVDSILSDSPYVVYFMLTNDYVKEFEKFKGYRNTVIVIDESGERARFLDFVDYLNKEDIVVYGVTKSTNSELAKKARITINQPLEQVLERLRS